MNKFTRTLLAAAVIGLVAGPVAASDESYSGSKAKIKWSGQNCKNDGNNNGQINFYSYITGGKNTRMWSSSAFDFGQIVDGEGPMLVTKLDKQAVMDLDNSSYTAIGIAFDNYTRAECKNSNGYNLGSAEVARFDIRYSRNGQKAKLQLDVRGTYDDFNKDKDRNLRFRYKVNMDRDLMS